MASALLGANNEVQRLADEPAESPETGEGSSPLGWLPRTLAAVALRLYSLDANLVYTEGGQPGREVLSVRSLLPQMLLMSVIESAKYWQRFLISNRAWLISPDKSIVSANACHCKMRNTDPSAYSWITLHVTLLCLQAYNYTQRPHALPKGSTQVDGESSACNIRSLSGQAVALGGRALPILLPSFPVVCHKQTYIRSSSLNMNV